ncbi:hypothetical protein GY45DRAFT_1278406 [Cubamyces sp. BRFM 1775]|nr:hypothetical protein GY45DRAFT_1278406 [Cubamyces sp. BRFM 1775]
MYSVLVTLTLAILASARPRHFSRSAFSLQNGQEAAALNAQFATLSASSPCTAGENACVNGQFAQCVNGQFVLQPCGGGLICAALPLVNSPGTSVTCTTAADRDARIAATGANAIQRRKHGQEKGERPARPPQGSFNIVGTVGLTLSSSEPVGTASLTVSSGNATATATSPAGSTSAAIVSASGKAASSSASAASIISVTSSATGAPPASTSTSASSNAANGTAATTGGDDPQTSLTLVESVIANGFAQDGQAQVEAGQVPSLTSTNNFINFCATLPGVPITNGQQIIGGSCNPAPMGVIASKSNMPSAKFVQPQNLDTIPANLNFTVKLEIAHLETGHFVNAATNYFAAPQVVNAQGDIQGHSHIVIEALTDLKQATPTDPTKFAYFKGLNAAAQGGILTVEVGGLPAGVYRMASINTAANHQPALVAVAQHGALDDMIYFTVQ